MSDPWKAKVEIGPHVLYLGDARLIFPQLSNIGSVVCDPPYGISHPCNFGERQRGALAQCNDYPDVYDDDKPFDPSWILAMDKPACLWGANYFCNKLPQSSGWLVWDKLRPDDLDQSTCELAWTNFVKGVRRFSHLWNGCMKDSEREENYHPTQKPVALFDWVLGLPWMPKGVVFDPYMGSGPCGVACARADRPYIGCEIVEDYFDIACRRIKAEVAQGKLFQ